jgi:anti-anti-sigma factor
VHYLTKPSLVLGFLSSGDASAFLRRVAHRGLAYSCSRGALTIEVERDGATLLISPRGELDISSTRALDVVLRKGVDGDAPRVILDLREVSFIDSTGLRLLVFALRAPTAMGTTFA